MSLPMVPAVLRRCTSPLARLRLKREKASQPVAAKVPPPERRFHPRLAVRFDAVLHVGEGTRAWNVRGVDISPCGALVLAGQPLVPGTVTFFHSLSHGQMGFARVQYCAREPRSSVYRIGLKFPSELMFAELGVWYISRVPMN